MLESDYTRQEERVNIRRLGEFSKPNLDSIYGPMARQEGTPTDMEGKESSADTTKPKEPLTFNPVLFSLILLAVGALIIGCGITLIFGIGWGLTTLGVMVFAVGFLTALNN